MKNVLAVALLCWLSLATGQRALAGSVEDQIKKLEQDWAQATVKEGAAAVDQYEAEDIVLDHRFWHCLAAVRHATLSVLQNSSDLPPGILLCQGRVPECSEAMEPPRQKKSRQFQVIRQTDSGEVPVSTASCYFGVTRSSMATTATTPKIAHLLE